MYASFIETIYLLVFSIVYIYMNAFRISLAMLEFCRYNFDVVNDLPLSGRYEWMEVGP